MRWELDLGLRCPDCASPISSKHAWGTGFLCHHCERRYQVPLSNARAWGLANATVGIVAVLLLGARGWQLAWCIPAGFFVVTAVSFEIRSRLFPPRLEPWNPDDKDWG